MVKLHSPIQEKMQQKQAIPVDMSRVASIILGGGQGKRLFPLTLTRSKPAITFGGRYRLIDVPISNSINSGCRKIFIVTQFLSSSLHHHITRSYRFDSFSSGFIELIPAEQKAETKEWFQGTADAVRQSMEYFIESPVDYFLILSGDQLYNLDFGDLVKTAKETDADLVIATIPVDDRDANRMGIMKINEEHFITSFHEKPKTSEALEEMRSPIGTLEAEGIDVSGGKEYLASMGIYLFKRQVLIDLLKTDPREDFGKHLIPTMIERGNTHAYLFGGYWEDIGTIDSFYKANIELTKPNPPFELYDEANPIFAARYNLPAAKIRDTYLKDTIICEGSLIEAKELINSVIGPRSMIRRGTRIIDSYVMGNDFYTPPIPSSQLPDSLLIEEDCLIRKAILEKHIHLGKGVKLINEKNLSHYDGDKIYIRDNIIIVTRGAKLPDGFVL